MQLPTGPAISLWWKIVDFEDMDRQVNFIREILLYTRGIIKKIYD